MEVTICWPANYTIFEATIDIADERDILCKRPSGLIDHKATQHPPHKSSQIVFLPEKLVGFHDGFGLFLCHVLKFYSQVLHLVGVIF
jgi:hypothetical protein